MKKNKNNRIKAFSLAEIIIVIAVALAIFVAVFNFGNSIFLFNSNSQKNLSAQTDARRALKNIIKELRMASPSGTGSYPISLASTTALTFFADIDNDTKKEQIRYFIQDSQLKRGVIEPSGTPVTYSSSSENVTILFHDVVNSANPIFEYFDSNYAGTSTPLTQPVNIKNIRFIRITLEIEKDKNKPLGPIVVKSQVFLRNLKDNL